MKCYILFFNKIKLWEPPKQSCCRGKGFTLLSKVLSMCTRGRPVEADPGGCHSDLWASWWHKTLQCTEGTVGHLKLYTLLQYVTYLMHKERLHACMDICFIVSAGAVCRVVRPRLTIYVCQESQQTREQQVKHENGDAAANTFFGQCVFMAHVCLL